ncbi:hypothetical protein ACLQ8Z_06220 [Bordetella hinzii]|uniref:hypothetical protein n=1 Tax=Bordetella hinzii TaxID=103855 RepID=UPI0039FCA588
MTFQQHIDALQSALAQTRTDFGGPAICSVMAEDLRVALHLIGQAALVPSAGSADSVRVVAWRARDGHGLPQTTWIDGDPGPQMESAWVGGDIECAYAGPVAAQAPIPEGQQPYPPTPAPDVQSSGEAEDSYSRAAVERAMRAAHDRGYSVGWDHGHAAQAPAAAMPDEIEGLRAHVALLKSALAQSERENDELRALAAAGDAQPAVWVAADTLNSPHPTCISSLAYMSQLDRDLGREYVPLYAAPVAAQAPRPCTCHPDDRPDGPCREKYAASECQAPAAASDARDAERYRWLRDQTETDGIAIVMKDKHFDESSTCAENIDKFIDAAIDAARKEKGHG